jgi:hypothetical protein
MTEQEWLASATPWGMIEAVAWPRTEAADRKLRLFACACCRQSWNPFVSPFVIRAVAAAEAFADGEITADALAGVREVVARAAQDAYREGRGSGTGYLSRVLEGCTSVCTIGSQIRAAEIARDVCHATARAAADVPPLRAEGGDRSPEYAAELAAQADLLRDIFGNPFREAAIDPAWRTSDVLALARGIYAERAFDRMPILADALQDAGCDDEEVLTHCREAREHARGCWVVDLLLGKG